MTNEYYVYKRADNAKGDRTWERNKYKDRERGRGEKGERNVLKRKY